MSYYGIATQKIIASITKFTANLFLPEFKNNKTHIHSSSFIDSDTKTAKIKKYIFLIHNQKDLMDKKQKTIKTDEKKSHVLRLLK